MSNGKDQQSPIQCSLVVTSDKTVKSGYRIPIDKMLNASTYRSYEANLVLADYEQQISVDSSGKWYGPNTIK